MQNRSRQVTGAGPAVDQAQKDPGICHSHGSVQGQMEGLKQLTFAKQSGSAFQDKRVFHPNNRITPATVFAVTTCRKCVNAQDFHIPENPGPAEAFG